MLPGGGTYQPAPGDSVLRLGVLLAGLASARPRLLYRQRPHERIASL